jgi:hypothetical protein
MDRTPRWLGVYIRAHARNVARRRPDDAMAAGLVQLPPEVKQHQLAAWHAIATGGAPPPSTAGVRDGGGMKVIKEADVANWLRRHGTGLPHNG